MTDYLDVNECEIGNGGCDHECTNSQGSFECTCRTGYLLAADNATCLGKGFQEMYRFVYHDCVYVCTTHADVDECSTEMPCSQTCTNLPGEFRCDCLEGYVLKEDKLTCAGM